MQSILFLEFYQGAKYLALAQKGLISDAMYLGSTVVVWSFFVKDDYLLS